MKTVNLKKTVMTVGGGINNINSKHPPSAPLNYVFISFKSRHKH